MTQTEFNSFFQRACIAFPGLRDWLTAASPDPQATVAVWAKTLEYTALQDADEALSGWTSGKYPDPPVGYKREIFALEVRAIAGRIFDERNKSMRREREQAKYSRGRNGPSAAFLSIAVPFGEILDHQASMVRGAITLEQYEFYRDEIIQAFGMKVQ